VTATRPGFSGGESREPGSAGDLFSRSVILTIEVALLRGTTGSLGGPLSRQLGKLMLRSWDRTSFFSRIPIPGDRLIVRQMVHDPVHASASALFSIFDLLANLPGNQSLPNHWRRCRRQMPGRRSGWTVRSGDIFSLMTGPHFCAVTPILPVRDARSWHGDDRRPPAAGNRPLSGSSCFGDDGSLQVSSKSSGRSSFVA